MLTDEEAIEIAKPILESLENAAGSKVYREIQLMVGRLAWEGVHKILNDPSNNDE